MSREDLIAWLTMARKLFAEPFGDPDCALRIIVANAQDANQAVEFRIPETDPQARTVSIVEPIPERARQTSPVLLRLPAQLEIQRRRAEPDGLPLLTPAALDECQAEIVRAVLNERLPGREIARRLNGQNPGQLRQVLADLKRRQVLDHTAQGYQATRLGRLSLLSRSRTPRPRLLPDPGEDVK